jgi:hypothetical protein
MTQSCKFRDPNIKNPKFGTYMTQLYKFSDRHWILLILNGFESWMVKMNFFQFFLSEVVPFSAISNL